MRMLYSEIVNKVYIHMRYERASPPQCVRHAFIICLRCCFIASAVHSEQQAHIVRTLYIYVWRQIRYMCTNDGLTLSMHKYIAQSVCDVCICCQFAAKVATLSMYWFVFIFARYSVFMLFISLYYSNIAAASKALSGLTKNYKRFKSPVMFYSFDWSELIAFIRESFSFCRAAHILLRLTVRTFQESVLFAKFIFL